MDIANAHNVREGDALTTVTAIAGNVTLREDDDAWTHSAPVEGFFVVLTVVIVPVAFLRLLRRLRSMSLVLGQRRHQDISS
jgi:hypothetical protein